MAFMAEVRSVASVLDLSFPVLTHIIVGFTGSGQAMRKDPSRNRHVYQINEELD